jgi:uncharacterized lipoprotein YddW (UPF0748 family)
MLIFLLAGLSTTAGMAQSARMVEPFLPSTASAWKPFANSPTVKSTTDGIAFPLPFAKPFLPFSAERDRVAWDKAVSFNLAPPIAFELDLFCAHPDSMRKFGLYFKSGNGWYVANKALTHAGRQTLTFSKSDFSIEGEVAGWNQIDGIRISPWRGTLLRNTELILHRLSTLEGQSVVLVRGTSSCPDDGARMVAAKTTERISRLLIEAGIGHALLTDDDLFKGLPSTATLVLLPYNPNPTAAQFSALQAFLQRGGKLGVFYGSSPALAAAMGFKLGSYVKADRPDVWRAIAFEDPSAWGLAPRIWQKSLNLFTISPSTPDSRTIAWWQDARGARRPEAAIVFSPKGFWMSHILLSDDQASKRDMLVSLCAHLDPSLWIPAAQRAIRQAGRINDFTSLSQAVAELQRRIPEAANPAAVQALLGEVSDLAARIPAAMTSGHPAEALQMARRQRQCLLRADAAVQRPKPGEFVGIWDHDGTGFIPGDWPATAALLAKRGVNALFPNVAWGGCAHYPSKFLPASQTFRLYGDQIAAALEAAKANRQQLHAWIVLWKLDGAPADFIERMKKEGRLQVTASGATRPWLSPHHPANRALMLNVIEEIAQLYPQLDGIHLDYVRLPDSLSCYASTTRARFELATGRKVVHWPADVQRNGPRNADFRRWRTEEITSFVAEARARLRSAVANMKLSAAVYGAVAPDGGNIAQYWPEWLRRNLVDFLTPMNYTESSAEFSSWLHTQTRFPQAEGRLIPGIGVTADESRLDPAQVARQIMLARQAGCPGVMLFSLTGTLRDETLPILCNGILRPLP